MDIRGREHTWTYMYIHNYKCIFKIPAHTLEFSRLKQYKAVNTESGGLRPVCGTLIIHILTQRVHVLVVC